MPVLASSAYYTCEYDLNLVRAILNDSEVEGGDVFTDDAVMTFDLLNAAYRRVQVELALSGVEVQKKTWWLIGLPSMPTLDPEARMIVSDIGCNILYPNGNGNIFSLVPQLPVDLVCPTKLWERQTNTSTFTAGPMKQRNGELLNTIQQCYLIDWQWQSEGLVFRGALQSQDVKIQGEKMLPQLAAPTDPVPIRGVSNAVAYYTAKAYAESVGGAISATVKQNAMEELEPLKMLSARRRQHKQVRRKPYSGRGGRSHTNF